MPTYGEKWRANSSACAYGHVPRSHSTPFIRLDSTGEISSVDHSSQGDSTRFSATPTREMNGNVVNMKNWVTNRVIGYNGLSASTLAGNKSNMNTTDFNSNLLDSITHSMNGSVANTMNSRYSTPKTMQPMCGISGWNYSGQGFGRVNTGVIGVFPCHQFSNSFTAPHFAYGQQGKMDMFSNPAFLTTAPFWSKAQMMEDQQWHQRHRKYDRSYRGHSPKHHKHEHLRHEKKSFPSKDVPSKDVPSKGTGKRRHEEVVGQVSSVSELTSPIVVNIERDSKLQSSKSKDTDIDISVKRPSRVSPDQCPSPTTAANIVKSDTCNNNSESSGRDAVQEIKVPEEKSSVKAELRKPNGICGITQDLNKMLTVNITNSSDSQSENANVSSEKSSASSMDPSKQESNFQVLFVRKNWKKGRPSSSKQRRRKLQKAKSAPACSEADIRTDADMETVNMVVTECKSEDANPTVPSEEDRKPGRCSATVSFLLGLSQSPSSPNVPNGSSASSSFVFSFSDDEVDGDNDDDWDADFDTDFDIEANFAQCDLFNFLPNNNGESSAPINLQVHISPLQNGPDVQDKTIEDINSSWNIQISLKEEKCKKNKPSKKVHFPEDKDLSVVHPMVAWSYAYRAARKGHWENFVRDRDRFKRRIAEIENVIVPVLDSNHRQAVYRKRFAETED